MTRPHSHIMEDLQTAYVSAVIAHAGYRTNTPSGKEYGSDLIVSKVKQMPNGRFTDTGLNINLQLKSCTNAFFEGERVVFDLDSEAYNKIAGWEGVSPCLLLLFKMPKRIQGWLTVEETGLRLSDCCYWVTLSQVTANLSQKRVKVPRVNVFNKQALDHVFNHVSKWDQLE